VSTYQEWVVRRQDGLSTVRINEPGFNYLTLNEIQALIAELQATVERMDGSGKSQQQLAYVALDEELDRLIRTANWHFFNPAQTYSDSDQDTTWSFSAGVYFVQRVDQLDRIKIGFTKSPKTRAHGLFHEYQRTPLNLIAYAESDAHKRFERLIQHRLSDAWLDGNGEMFQAEPVLTFLAGVKSLAEVGL
jgi:hypothetical protein